MLPFVSVVVPIYNRADLLQQLLDSLLELRYPRDRFEVILVDNGSTDGAWELAKLAVAEAPYSLRALRNETAIRLPAVSRNLGFQASRGEIVAMTDGDCVVTPNWLIEGIAPFQGNIAIVQGKTLPHPEQPRPMLYRTVQVLDKGYGETCNIFYRRDVFEKAGGFHRDFFTHSWGEDTDLAYRILELGYDWAFAENSLVYHQILPQTPLGWLFEPFRIFTWTKAVRRHPRIRRDLLCLRYFLNKGTALFNLLLVAIALGVYLHPGCLVLGFPFWYYKFTESEKHRGLLRRVLRMAAGTVRSFVIFGVLVCSSIRYRSLVL